MNFGISGKRVLIVGGSKNIGAAIAKAFILEGCKIVLVSRDKNRLIKTISEIDGTDKKHGFIDANLLDNGMPTIISKKLLAKYNNFDIVVHNVGGALGIKDPLADIENWDLVWRFNVGIAIEMNKLLIPPMINNHWGRVIHISVAEPFCPELQNIILNITKKQEIQIHKDCTYVCIEGPRFSTKAESKFFRTTGADIIGMTLVPECQLAREAQICYVSISTVTDYDVWAEKPVTAKEVMETLAKNVEITKKLLTLIIDEIPKTKLCACEKALEEAEF